MKTIKNLLLGMLVFAFMLTTKTYGQEEEPKEEFKPVFITVTTGHWSSDPDVDYSDWLKTEKEYFDKVTMKNDLVIGSGYYRHFYTPDNSEILFVSVYSSWEDIEKSNDVTAKLVEEAWPDEEARKAFFKKQSSYYSPVHSDEIYASVPFTKDLQTDSKEPLVYYVRKNIMGTGGNDMFDIFKEFHENVIMKNSYIKGYYTQRHRWGSNSRDALEIFVFDKFEDIEKASDESDRLADEHWPDEDKRKEYFKEFNKIFAGHGDFIYTNVPELAK